METKATDLVRRFRSAQTDIDRRFIFCFLRNLNGLEHLSRNDWEVAQRLFPGKRIGNPYAAVSGYVSWGER